MANRFAPVVAARAAGGIFELRTYSVVPQHMAAFVATGADKYHLRAAHSPMCGYWMTEVGGLNEVVHLWHFTSLAHRNEVRKALKADKAWAAEYLAPTRHMVAAQTNELLLPLEGFQVSTRSRSTTAGEAFYHLRKEPLALDGTASAQESTGNVEVCGQWLTAGAGVDGCKVTLSRSADVDALLDHAGMVPGSTCKLLLVAEHARRNSAWYQ
jgi:hypothetical protein